MNLEQDTYWNEDTKLFDGTFPSLSSEGSPHIVKVHAKIHTSEETYYEGNREIIPITPRKGKRTNFMIHPYVAVPNITLTIRIPPNGYADTSAIGKVQSTQVEGFRDIKIGHCQAWYYQDAKVLTLWECFLEEPHRSSAAPADDKNMRQLWQSIEHYLHAKLPQAERIITPFSDPLFEREAYQTFLKSLGYEPVAQTAYGKLF